MTSLGTPNFARYLMTLPDFLAYFGASILLLLLFVLVYTQLTPHREWQLIRGGNPSAAISMGAALLGFALPLSSAINHSETFYDMLVWGVVALVVQWIAFIVARLLMPGLPQRIEQNDLAAATATGAIALSVGILNAACLTY